MAPAIRQTKPPSPPGGMQGSAAAPGNAGEALVGQTSLPGVRLSDFDFSAFFLRYSNELFSILPLLRLRLFLMQNPELFLHKNGII
ncbi:hypothetical protein [Paraburkholderia hayleyella]|uniref:hypothetical protein n=1 Tax=Paraburkholderia hayleyella TaxID=2152889 RepID=UPI001291A23B|nr:hypothetical protein [Paraburkholderia hayleyella]